MRVLMPIFLIAVLGLASCVPVPIPNDYGFYAPDSRDVNFAESNRGGSYCAINGSQPWKRGYRIIGNMKATVWFETVNKDVSNAQGDLYLKFGPIRESDTIVSIDPALISLEEGGRTFKAASGNNPAPGNSITGNFLFPTPSGVRTNIRVVFEPGAIKFDDQPIPFAPIRFSNGTTAIYFFPCIPA